MLIDGVLDLEYGDTVSLNLWRLVHNYFGVSNDEIAASNESRFFIGENGLYGYLHVYYDQQWQEYIIEWWDGKNEGNPCGLHGEMMSISEINEDERYIDLYGYEAGDDTELRIGFDQAIYCLEKVD